MHATALNAVAEKPQFSIEAAVASLAPNITRLASAADVAIAGKITVAEIDRKLSSSRLSTIEKLQLKIGLNRAGLLVD
jgi:hypothetical protein